MIHNSIGVDHWPVVAPASASTSLHVQHQLSVLEITVSWPNFVGPCGVAISGHQCRGPSFNAGWFSSHAIVRLQEPQMQKSWENLDQFSRKNTKRTQKTNSRKWYWDLFKNPGFQSFLWKRWTGVERWWKDVKTDWCGEWINKPIISKGSSTSCTSQEPATDWSRNASQLLRTKLVGFSKTWLDLNLRRQKSPGIQTHPLSQSGQNCWVVRCLPFHQSQHLPKLVTSGFQRLLRTGSENSNSCGWEGLTWVSSYFVPPD